MNNQNLIIENMDNPHELERMYRKDPKAFKKSFSQAWDENSDSQVLAAWYERLHFKGKTNAEKIITVSKRFLIHGHVSYSSWAKH